MVFLLMEMNLGWLFDLRIYRPWLHSERYGAMCSRAVNSISGTFQISSSARCRPETRPRRENEADLYIRLRTSHAAARGTPAKIKVLRLMAALLPCSRQVTAGA